MCRICITVLALFIAVHANAQTFEVDTLIKNGPLNKRMNMVFLGDGYTATEQTKFIADVEAMLPKIFDVQPLKEYASYFNVFAIKVISTQSGANHPKTTADLDCAGVPATTVNNYFGSTFDYGGIHRLLYPAQAGKIMSVLSQHLPNYTQAFIIVNTPYYGGAGGFVATSSTHSAGPEIAIHEIGHSFAGLADEYWAGEQYAMEKPNLTQQSSSSLVKWKNWIGVNDVGVIQYSESPSWYRPHRECGMRYLNYPFCNVCIETFVEKIHALLNPIVTYSPVQKAVPLPEADEVIEFSLNLIEPQPNTLRVIWQQDNVVKTKNQNSFSVLIPSAMEGSTVIKAIISDTTALTRSATHMSGHVYTIEWMVGQTITGLDIHSVEQEYELKLYPNPVDHELNIIYLLSKQADVLVTITDSNGKTVYSVENTQVAGEHAVTLRSNKTFKSAGVYYVTASFNGASVVQKIVVR